MSDCDVCGKPWHSADKVVLRELRTTFRGRSLFINGTDADAEAMEAWLRDELRVDITKRELAIDGSQAATIHDLRFGYRDIQQFTDRDIVAIMDYNLPADVMQLCYDEITLRRRQRLEDKRND